MQPQPHALSQSYRFLTVSLCGSWSCGAGLKWASGQRTGASGNQDGSRSQNHHPCHADLILREDAIIVILSTGCHWKEQMWAGFSLYAAKCVDGEHPASNMKKESKECPAKAGVWRLVSLTSQRSGFLTVIRCLCLERENRDQLKH